MKLNFKDLSKKEKILLIIRFSVLFAVLLIWGLSACKKGDSNNNNNDNDEPNIVIDYETYNISDTEIGLASYTGGSKDELIIPEVIDGKNVVALGDNIFAGAEHEIASIIIPKSVRLIGKKAFYNNLHITRVTFRSGSDLETIEELAFSNTKNLTEFTIPSKVMDIREGAFRGSGITKFTILDNPYYQWEDNFLINTNVTDENSSIAIYAYPETRDVVVPSSVKVLAAYLFENNQNIDSIDLNQVEYLGVGVFADSSVSSITGENVKDIDMDALLNTPWLANQTNEFVILGSVLIKYLGEDSEVIVPEGIIQIGHNSFSSSNIRSIVLPESITSIGKNAFINCEALESIEFNSTRPPLINGDSFASKVKIYVPESYYNYYKNNVLFKNISNEIIAK